MALSTHMVLNVKPRLPNNPFEIVKNDGVKCVAMEHAALLVLSHIYLTKYLLKFPLKPLIVSVYESLYFDLSLYVSIENIFWKYPIQTLFECANWKRSKKVSIEIAKCLHWKSQMKVSIENLKWKCLLKVFPGIVQWT